jgi:hypothetical protein
MNRHISLTCILFFLVSTISFSQVATPTSLSTGFRQNVFGLGFFAGASGGFGLSFRHHLPGALSYQITGGIIKTDGKVRSDIGAEINFDLARGGGARFFAAGGIGYYHSGSDGNEMSAPTRGGFGLGGEWMMGGGLHFLAEGMFTFFSDGNILPLPQVGIYYYF